MTEIPVAEVPEAPYIPLLPAGAMAAEEEAFKKNKYFFLDFTYLKVYIVYIQYFNA